MEGMPYELGHLTVQELLTEAESTSRALDDAWHERRRLKARLDEFVDTTSTELNANNALQVTNAGSNASANANATLSPTSTSTLSLSSSSTSAGGDGVNVGGASEPNALSAALMPFIDKATATARRALAASAMATEEAEREEDERRDGKGQKEQGEGADVNGDLLLESHSSIASACKVLDAEIRTFAATKRRIKEAHQGRERALRDLDRMTHEYADVMKQVRAFMERAQGLGSGSGSEAVNGGSDGLRGRSGGDGGVGGGGGGGVSGGSGGGEGGGGGGSGGDGDGGEGWVLPEQVTQSIGRVDDAVSAAETVMQQARAAIRGKDEDSTATVTPSVKAAAIALKDWPRIEPLAVARMEEWRQRTTETSYLVIRELAALDLLEQQRRHEQLALSSALSSTDPSVELQIRRVRVCECVFVAAR